MLLVVTNDWQVKWQSRDLFVVFDLENFVAMQVDIGDQVAAVFDSYFAQIAAELPGVFADQPGVWSLNLDPFPDLLFKSAILVS